MLTQRITDPSQSEACLYAIDPVTGKTQWRQYVDRQVSHLYQSSPVLDDDENIYVGAGYYAYVFTTTGGWSWWTKLPGRVEVSPAFDSSNSHVYFAAGNRLYCWISINGLLSRCTGNNWWPPEEGLPSPDGSDFGTPTVGSDGTVYIQSASHLYAFDPDGNKKWEKAQLGYNLRYKQDSTPAIGPMGPSMFPESRLFYRLFEILETQQKSSGRSVRAALQQSMPMESFTLQIVRMSGH